MGSLYQAEVCLLRHSCGLAPVDDVQPPTESELTAAARLITSGRYIEALRSAPALRALLDCTAIGIPTPTTSSEAASGTSATPDLESGAEAYYRTVRERATAAVDAALTSASAATEATAAGGAEATASDACTGAAAGPPLPCEQAASLGAVLLAGVASLHIFVQYNLTGPSAGPPPPSPLDLFAPPPVAAHFAAAPPPPTPAVAGGAAAAIAAVLGKPAPAPAAAALAPEAPAGTAAAGAASAAAKPDGLGGLGVDSVSRGDRWAMQQLQLDGEDLVGRCPALQWLLLARTLLMTPLRLGGSRAAGEQGPQAGADADADAATGRADAVAGAVCEALSRLSPSWPWWSLRCVTSHAGALEGRSHSLLREASQLIKLLVGPSSPWGTVAASDSAAATAAAATSVDPTSDTAAALERAALGGVCALECALVQLSYGYVDAGRQYLGRAGELLGLQPQLTGAMGKRTVHQIDPKAQLVVVASPAQRSAPPAAHPGTPTGELGLDAASYSAASSSGAAAAPGGGGGSTGARGELEGLADHSDVFPAPVLVGEDGALLETSYSPPEQALLLGWATAVKKATSADDLQEWQMAPWVEAVLGQKRSAFITAAAARLLKTRHERTRSRTRERALLAMDTLAEAVAAAGVREAAAAGGGGGDAAEASTSEAAGARAALSWAVRFPVQVSLRREAAEHYVSMGLVGAAIRVFESLELWDSALTCYRLLGKKALAEELVHRRLAVTPDDPKLWCALGDLHLEDRFYEEAWERSGRQHTRSQRSLARSAMRRKDYPKAAGHWEAALALNPLHPEAWFSLGFCRLKAERHRDALRAFTRVTQQEPDNGEAWNNIAALWMHLGGYKPAFAALSESVKHKRDSWQTWENYGRAALASGHYQAAVRGMQRALQLSGGQRLFVDVASGLLDALEGRAPPRDGGTSEAAAAAAAAQGLHGLGLGGGEEGEQGGDASLQEEEAALGVPLLPLLAELPLGAPGGGDAQQTGVEAEAAEQPSAGGAEAADASPSGQAQQQAQQAQAQQQLISGREREAVLGGLGAVLREGVSGPAAGPGLWGCLARYWALRGEADSAKEARLKQVRSLAGGAFKSDPARFVEYADASEALARAYLNCFRLGRPGGVKDLAAGRMHLRGLLRTTQEAFGEHPAHARLQTLLEEITQLEDAAIAASRAAKDA